MGKHQTYIGQMVSEAFLTECLVAAQAEMVSLGVKAFAAQRALN